MRLPVAAALGWLTVAHAAAQPARAQIPEAAVPFRVGETLTYDVTLSSYVVAGTAVTTVEGKRTVSNTSAYHIVAEGRPVPMFASLYALYAKMETLLDSVTLLPHRVSLYSEAGEQKRVGRTTFDRLARQASFEVEPQTARRRTFDVPQQVQDGLSALYVLRAMTLKAGDRVVLPVVAEGSVYTVRADVAGRERVSVPLGDVDAWNLKVAVSGGARESVASNIGVWVSADARRLPLKFEADLPAGRFAVLLRQAD
jgi:hypothetical protein